MSQWEEKRKFSELLRSEYIASERAKSLVTLVQFSIIAKEGILHDPLIRELCDNAFDGDMDSTGRYVCIGFERALKGLGVQSDELRSAIDSVRAINESIRDRFDL